MKKQHIAGVFTARAAITLVATTATLLIAGCTTLPSAEESLAAIKSSFSERGIAKLDRLDQTEIQRLCSEANMTGKDIDKKTADKIQTALYDKIPYPKDGFIGDWREGERIAQNGRGMQFTDAAGVPNGANCYACHQISPQEISYGNQGPSLLKYGAIRQVKDANSKEAEPIVKYTWARIWNTHSVNLCSNMPRFGDAGILTEQQIKHVMALLLSPDSPVNK
ncbi:sulfur oxidation c-type cytochrome SoxX [Variovorax sp. PCZ-1]|uniref:sulfur oxidation c-type cytochrome SoxX n=1 Tax=Variovorax sp. PCZ-1 TaxID=2835533 RepID=UPI001BD05AC3|nr:sulfur oxidation c-type cytochrome SoxX [Variovorax sp. PCZ-1]MBS7807182.1 sulfur oxidation c-type cytochrome SoxX [Variovorax sp. PCZ-1]